MALEVIVKRAVIIMVLNLINEFNGLCCSDSIVVWTITCNGINLDLAILFGNV